MVLNKENQQDIGVAKFTRPKVIETLFRNHGLNGSQLAKMKKSIPDMSLP